MLSKLRTVPSYQTLILLLFGCIALRFISLGLYPLMDTTEARYGEIARIMAQTGNWLTPMFDFQVPFWGKPPMFAWLSGLGFNLFGIHAFAARLPHFLVACGVLWLVYDCAQKHFNSRRLGLFASSLLASTFSFLIVAGAITTDTALTFSITLSMVSFWRAWHGKGRIWGYLFFVGLALGMLSKGPIAVVLVAISLTLWLLPNSRWKQLNQALPLGFGILLFLAISIPWYAYEEYQSPGFLNYFIIGEHIKGFIISGWQGDLYGRSHQQIRGTIWVYAFVAMLPWTPILIAQLIRLVKADQDIQESDNGFGSYLLFWLLSPLLLFTFAGNILITYAMPSLPALALLLVYYQHHRALPRWVYSIGFITPALFLFSLSAVHFHYADKLSEEKMISIWQLQNEANSADLYYLRQRPFSADFYSRGKAQQRSGMVSSWLPEQKKPFFIVQPVESSENYPHWSCAERTEVEKKVLLYCSPDTHQPIQTNGQ